MQYLFGENGQWWRRRPVMFVFQFDAVVGFAKQEAEQLNPVDQGSEGHVYAMGFILRRARIALAADLHGLPPSDSEEIVGAAENRDEGLARVGEGPAL